MIRILLLLLFSSYAISDDTWSCKLDMEFTEGGSKEISVDISINNNSINNLSIISCYSSGEIGGGGCCFFGSEEIESNNLEYEIINNSHTFYNDYSESIINLEKTDNELIIRSSIAREFCGFASEVPETIKLYTSHSRCVVE